MQFGNACDVADVVIALLSAHAAFGSWRYPDRAALLQRGYSLTELHAAQPHPCHDDFALLRSNHKQEKPCRLAERVVTVSEQRQATAKACASVVVVH